MQVNEPMTLVTDYVLGTLCVVLAVRLLRLEADASRNCWATALAICAISAFGGGTYHGFLPWMDDAVSGPLWTIVLMSIGCAAFFATVATSRGHLPSRWQRPVEIVAGVQLAAYLFAATRSADFIIAIVDYSIAFGFVLVVHGWAWIRTRDLAARWIAVGVLVSFLAAGIQASGLAPHPHFNHNDLYHVVQMVGMWMLYKGASGIVSRQD